MVYVFLADGFEEIEALTVVDILRRSKIAVKTVAVMGSLKVTGSHDITVLADIKSDEYILNDAEMIVLPGGMPGTINLEESKLIREAITHCVNNHIFVAAICAAPSILGHMGYAKGKNMTCFPEFESELIGAKVSQNGVVQDGKIITAKGCGVSMEFALKLVSVLKSQELANELRIKMQCK